MSKNIDNIDDTLRSLIKRDLPIERKDEWFVKKVMNRLPEKRKPTFSRPELISFVFSIFILISGWLWLWNRFNTEESLTYGSLAMGGVLIVMTFGLLATIAYPILRHN